MISGERVDWTCFRISFIRNHVQLILTINVYLLCRGRHSFVAKAFTVIVVTATLVMSADSRCPCNFVLTYWGLVTPFGDIDLGQHWLREWLVTWRHQDITWSNVDLSSVRPSGIHLRAISQEIPQPPFTNISLKITNLKLNWNLQGPMIDTGCALVITSWNCDMQFFIHALPSTSLNLRWS